MNRTNDYLKGNQYAKGNSPNITSFEKGHTPWNKNKKGIHLSPASEFKKGQKSNKWMPVGTIRTRIDKNKAKRNWIKIEEPNQWVLVAVFNWLKNNGTIPDGFLIHHIDENALNDNVSNLCLVTRSTHINLHRKSLLKAKKKYELLESK